MFTNPFNLFVLPASAEESSILDGAQVDSKYLVNGDSLAGDLIGRGFNNHVQFLNDNSNNPDYDDSAEFKIILKEPAKVHTVMIVNYCNPRGFRNSLGSSQLLLGMDRADFTTENPVIVEKIVDGGFRVSDFLTKGDVVSLRRIGPDPDTNSSNMKLNEIRLYEVPNLLKELQEGKVKITDNTTVA